ncbi:MAG: hypothetical protein HY023_15280, partial [Chloroflexi bacterium]|nr:hypothetical protein [Chloroflexota bacterium]
HDGQVMLISVAPPEAEEILEMYLGIGASVFARVWDDGLDGADQFGVALTLARAAARFSPDVILCGERSVGDYGTGLIGPLLAERLGWPFVGRVSSFQVGIGAAIAHRLVERGDKLTIQTPLPAVLSVSREANEPRYPALAKIRRARRETLDLAALGLTRDDLAAAHSPASVVGWAAARPRPKKLFAPPSTASAADRLRMVSGGGPARKAQDQFVEAPPERSAELILAVLKQEKVIT